MREFKIQEMGPDDRAVWAAMRHALWPEESAQAHAKALDDVFASDDYWGFLAQSPEGAPAGFAEVAVRRYANGCETQPVPFLEGIWVDAQFRRNGLGRQLIKHIETFVAARGFREFGSDALIDNNASHAAHQAWGFSETERVVYFRKVLKDR